MPSLLGIYAKSGHLPQPWQILFCHDETSEDDVLQLLARCFHPRLVPKTQHLSEFFAIINAHKLSTTVQDTLQHHLASYQREFPDAPHKLVITVAPALTTSTLDALGCPRTRLHLTCAALKVSLLHLGTPDGVSHVTCICCGQRLLCEHRHNATTHTSESSGQGKSAAIAMACTEAGKTCTRVLIGGPFDRQDVVRRLQSLDDPRTCAVHLDLHATSDEHVDAILFEMLLIGRLYDCKTQRTAFLPDATSVFVEVENVPDHP